MGSTPVSGTEPTGVLTLERAIEHAVDNDPGLKQLTHQQQSLRDQSTAAGRLPDPKLSFQLANFPVDTFDFDQEGMTQIKLGVSQAFPRGRSRHIRSEQLGLQSEKQQWQQQERQAQIRRQVALTWYDLWFTQAATALVEANRPLFEQLLEVTLAQYASGERQQQDVVRAQLELSRLADRIQQLQQQSATLRGELARWLPYQQAQARLPLSFEPGMPVQDISRLTFAELAQRISGHPRVRLAEQEVQIRQTEVSLARQNYKPEWALQAVYGRRGKGGTTNHLADFLSLGVTMDMPFFTANKQDKQLSAAQYSAEAAKDQRLLLIQQMAGQLERERATLAELATRLQFYRTTLLEQTREQSEASLNAYTAATGDFAEVMRAYIAEMELQIEAFRLETAREQILVRIHYLLTHQSTPETEIASK